MSQVHLDIPELFSMKIEIVNKNTIDSIISDTSLTEIKTKYTRVQIFKSSDEKYIVVDKNYFCDGYVIMGWKNVLKSLNYSLSIIKKGSDWVYSFTIRDFEILDSLIQKKEKTIVENKEDKRHDIVFSVGDWFVLTDINRDRFCEVFIANNSEYLMQIGELGKYYISPEMYEKADEKLKKY